MCRFCESRGIAGLPSKRMKYLPGWFFYVGLAFVLLAMFAVGIWSGFARDRQRRKRRKKRPPMRIMNGRKPLTLRTILIMCRWTDR